VKISLLKLFKIAGQILLKLISGTGDGDPPTANVGGKSSTGGNKKNDASPPTSHLHLFLFPY
jgi:hypothetical protein